MNPRQRTNSAQYMVGSSFTSASPPKFVSLEEIMQAANSMRDMALVHQIVVDEDFHLKKPEVEPNSVQKVIKDTMHRAFWDVLRQQLSEETPNYTQALVLLEDIKEGLYSVLLPQHTKTRQQISEVLDSALIKQQAEQGTIDFRGYAQFVIGIMGKLCAPIRDERIKELTETTDVIDTFRGILETLDLMVLDMANFTLRLARPDIIACSVELERKKFADFLAIQSDGLEQTRKWLLKYVDLNQQVPASPEYDLFVKNTYKRAFCQACWDLIDWNASKPFPETFMLDEERLRDLQLKTERLIITATALLVTLSNTSVDLHTIEKFKTVLKDHIMILLQSYKTEKDLDEILKNVSEQVITDAKETIIKHHLPEMNPAAVNTIRQQIMDIANPEHKVRAIVKQRVREFYHNIIESSTANPQKVPSGLTALQEPLVAVAGQLLRIVSHNETVFCIYYHKIVAEALPKAS
ncbi:T-complex protein 11-like protein 1 isoform X2 [Aethina tumida]|uniref:T-complex protein 11-like protein 1 isoform X2 n=1 Tax=Aethina tumida TaxID=116153 RepID=UPI0021476EAE|nr:T-complex protein 11-like protein 1 isoform X2 [Aethina tumida]XP_049825444.1 T-complex protein 11-like protein 1 isoform X2 [Aethina tumida]